MLFYFPSYPTDRVMEFAFFDDELGRIGAWSTVGVSEELDDETDDPTGNYVVDATVPDGAEQLRLRDSDDHSIQGVVALGGADNDEVLAALAAVQSTANSIYSKLQDAAPGDEPVLILPAPVEADKCRVYGYLIRPDNSPAANATVNFELVRKGPMRAGSNIIAGRTIEAKTDSAGLLDQEVPRNDGITPGGTMWRIQCDEAQLSILKSLEEATFNPASEIA